MLDRTLTKQIQSDRRLAVALTEALELCSCKQESIVIEGLINRVNNRMADGISAAVMFYLKGLTIEQAENAMDKLNNKFTDYANGD